MLLEKRQLVAAGRRVRCERVMKINLMAPIVTATVTYPKVKMDFTALLNLGFGYFLYPPHNLFDATHCFFFCFRVLKSHRASCGLITTSVLPAVLANKKFRILWANDCHCHTVNIKLHWADFISVFLPSHLKRNRKKFDSNLLPLAVDYILLMAILNGRTFIHYSIHLLCPRTFWTDAAVLDLGLPVDASYNVDRCLLVELVCLRTRHAV